MEGERLIQKPHSRVLGEMSGVGVKVEQESETSADEQESDTASMTFIRRRETESHRKAIHGMYLKLGTL